MAEIVVGPRVRKSPFYDAVVACGVSSVSIYNHMFLPISYGDLLAEYERLTSAVVLWDVAAQRQVEISGPQATELAQLVSARRLVDLRPGRARYAPMCDQRGCLINDPVALRLAEDRWWFSLADSDMLHWISAVGASAGLDAEVFEPDVSPLALQGPRAEAVARDLFGAEITESIGFFGHRPVELDGIPMQLSRSGWSRQGGFEMFLTDGSRGIELWDKVMCAGEPYGIGPGGPHPMERIESGLLSYGADTDADTDPIEAGLAAFVALDDDTEFIGKQALLARQADPQNRRKLVNLVFDAAVPNAENPWPMTRKARPAGECRAAVWSPKLGCHIGLGLVGAAHSQPGTTFEVHAPDGSAAATLSATPFGVSL